MGGRAARPGRLVTGHLDGWDGHRRRGVADQQLGSGHSTTMRSLRVLGATNASMYRTIRSVPAS